MNAFDKVDDFLGTMFYTLTDVEKIIWQVDLGMTYICLLDQKETIDSFTSYITSIDRYIIMYQELLYFLKKNNYPDSDLALAERQIMHFTVEKKMDS